MKERERAVLTELDRAEMMRLVGGSGTPGGSFAYDLGRLIGTTVGAIVMVLTNPPEANYAYGKVGYAT